MDYSTALTLVRFVANNAPRDAGTYDADMLREACAIVRLHIAFRQSNRERDTGARCKKLARRALVEYLTNDPARGGVYRHFDMLSRRAYRAAAKYDRTVTRARSVLYALAPVQHVPALLAQQAA